MVIDMKRIHYMMPTCTNTLKSLPCVLGGFLVLFLLVGNKNDYIIHGVKTQYCFQKTKWGGGDKSIIPHKQQLRNRDHPWRNSIYCLLTCLAGISAIKLADLTSWWNATSKWDDSSLISSKWNWNFQGLDSIWEAHITTLLVPYYDLIWNWLEM